MQNISNIFEQAGELLVESDYCDKCVVVASATGILVQIIFDLGTGEVVDPWADTLAGYRQAMEVENQLANEYTITLWLKSEDEVPIKGDLNWHRWRGARIKWCLEQIMAREIKGECRYCGVNDWKLDCGFGFCNGCSKPSK